MFVKTAYAAIPLPTPASFGSCCSDKGKKVIVENAKNDKIYTRIGVAEKKDIDDGSPAEKSLAKLIGTDGKPLPAITGEFQDLVVDLAANGLALGGGSNAFQLGTWQAMTLDIDYENKSGKGDGSPILVEPSPSF